MLYEVITATSLSSFVTFLISLIVLVAVAAVRNIQPTFHLFEAVIPIVALLLLTTGVGLVLATLDVFFRDLEYLWGVIMMMIMYVITSYSIHYTKLYEIPNMEFLYFNLISFFTSSFNKNLYFVKFDSNLCTYFSPIFLFNLLLGRNNFV